MNELSALLHIGLTARPVIGPRGHRVAWHGDTKALNIIGTGENIIPSIHVQDLSNIVTSVADAKPKTRYIVAVDDSMNSMTDIITDKCADAAAVDVTLKMYHNDTTICSAGISGVGCDFKFTLVTTSVNRTTTTRVAMSTVFLHLTTTALKTGPGESQQACSRCRAFDLWLGCEPEDNKVVSLFNGHKCAAVENANVKLNCSLGDSDGLTLEYKWYKSSKVGGQSLASMASDAKQINCTFEVCDLSEVTWSSEMNLEKHDSHFYQCVVTVKEGADEAVKTVATLYSNVLAVDVQKYVAPAGEMVSESHSVDIGTAEVKLACALPTTNPPSTAVWIYSKDADSNATAISNQANMIVVQNTIISTDAKFGYSVGMLVIMNFKADNVGVYKCAVQHQTLLGVVNQKDVGLSHCGITQTSVSESLRIVSKVQNPAFLFNDTDTTTLTCLGSNIVAGETAQHYWQKAESVDGVIAYKNITSSADFQVSNNGRSLTFTRDYSLAGTTFRCQIQKGVHSILINELHQAPIIPKSGHIPTGLQCGVSNSSVTVGIDNLLTADVSSTGVVQVLAGSSYFWKVDNAVINKFTEGYTVSSSSLGMEVKGDEQCHYLQNFKYIDNLYSVQQILAVSVLPEDYKTAPTVELTESGGDIVTITCTSKLDSIPETLQEKLGLNVLFDVGGCMEYTDAVVEVSDNTGTCDESVTRWMKLNKKKLCSECVVKCAAATSCVTSEEKIVKVPAGKENCGSGETGAVTDESGLPTWGVALICVVVILGVIFISAVFFYTYMQRQQNHSDGKILGATVLKVDAADDKIYSVPAKSPTKEVENAEIVKTITLTDENSPDLP
ncbi:uncharacterized protein LOC134819859 [Bolinopsis microptera]|uniref:uncharacterized protein LOC134819859 n=1 Tax=Bolinopsis microptera TaxID=2820187 RepID=UPI00307B0224